MADKAAERDILDLEPMQSPPRDRSLTPVSTKTEPIEPSDGGSAWIVFAGLVLALIWIGGSAAYVIGFTGIASLAELTPVQMTGMGFILGAPALFILLAALAARQMARFGRQARLVAEASERLLNPEATAAANAQALSAKVSGEIDRVNKGMEAALARLSAMEEILKHHGESIETAGQTASTRSESLIRDLKTERDALSELAETLDAKAKSVADAISEQSNMVARAAELAESAVLEGRTALSEASDQLGQTAQNAADKAKDAGGALETQTHRLAALGDTLDDKRKALADSYVAHSAHLEAASRTMREEQDKIAASLDFHRAELDSIIRVARKGADELREATETGSQALRSGVEAATGQAERFGEIIREKTREAADQNAREIARLTEAADAARRAADEANEALAAQARSLREQVDKLNETTFDTANRADETLRKRMDEIARSIQDASDTAEDADKALAARFDRSLDSWRERMEAMESRLNALRADMDALPDKAGDHVAKLEDSVRASMTALSQAARDAAADAREIDAALQSRMRQNYELLSDFVLRMGSVAGGRAAPADEDLPSPLAVRSERGRETERGWRWRDVVSDMKGRDESESAAGDPLDPSRITGETADVAAMARRGSGIAAMREAVQNALGEDWRTLEAQINADDILRAQARDAVKDAETDISRAAREESPDALKAELRTERGRRYLLASALLDSA